MYLLENNRFSCVLASMQLGKTIIIDYLLFKLILILMKFF